MTNSDPNRASNLTESPSEPSGQKPLRHWREQQDEQGLYWLALDKADSSANTLAEEVLEELDRLLALAEQLRPRGVIIHSAKANGFIAGADIREFIGQRDVNALHQKLSRGHGVLNRLAGLPMPTVALIHGFCLGGGLELALACRYRIASDDASLGFPEVKLGIHPGLGGTARATRLMPAPAAMELMLTGRSLEARKARKMGLVDVVTLRRHLHTAARRAVLEGLKVRRSGMWANLFNLKPARQSLARILRRKTAEKVRREHYPAPFALIDLWQRYGGSQKRLLEEEARSCAELLTSDTAQNLVRVFFLRERLKSLGKKADFPAHHVHVIGAGVMGGDIAAWCALQGLTVTLQDPYEEQIGSSVGRAAKLFAKRLGKGAALKGALDRLIPDRRGYGLARADVVIEAIVEKLEAKQALFKDIEPKLKPEALLATNTSSIPLDQLGEALADPRRLVGLHFFNPVAKMPLVEVIQSEATDAQAAENARHFTTRIDRLPLPVRSAPGFLVNRALMPYLMEAFTLVEEGIPPAAIDEAAESFGMPMGPIELADSVGLDICLDVGERLADAFGGKVPDKLRELVGQDCKGRKSGQGFYRYENGKPQKPKEKPKADPALADRLILPMLNTCVACLREGVVEDADQVDAGMIFGTGFAPFRGGPMHYLQETGKETLHRRLSELEQTYGERFRPDSGWANL